VEQLKTLWEESNRGVGAMTKNLVRLGLLKEGKQRGKTRKLKANEASELA
jgi:hypothetical protein